MFYEKLKREYVTRFSQKSFWVLLLVGFLLIVNASNWTMAVSRSVPLRSRMQRKRFLKRSSKKRNLMRSHWLSTNDDWKKTSFSEEQITKGDKIIQLSHNVVTRTKTPAQKTLTSSTRNAPKKRQTSSRLTLRPNRKKSLVVNKKPQLITKPTLKKPVIVQKNRIGLQSKKENIVVPTEIKPLKTIESLDQAKSKNGNRITDNSDSTIIKTKVINSKLTLRRKTELEDEIDRKNKSLSLEDESEDHIRDLYLPLIDMRNIDLQEKIEETLSDINYAEEEFDEDDEDPAIIEKYGDERIWPQLMRSKYVFDPVATKKEAQNVSKEHRISTAKKHSVSPINHLQHNLLADKFNFDLQNNNIQREKYNSIRIGMTLNRNGKNAIAHYGKTSLEFNLDAAYKLSRFSKDIVKKSFTIHKNISLKNFLLQNNVEDSQALKVVSLLRNTMPIESLQVNQNILLVLRKTGNKIGRNSCVYNLQKLVIFFRDRCVIIKMKNGKNAVKTLSHHDDKQKFSFVEINNIKNITKLQLLEQTKSQKDSDFLLASIKLIIKKIKNKNLQIIKARLVFEEQNNTAFAEKISKKPVAIIVETSTEVFKSYIYKDLAGNIHLLDSAGTSLSVEILDLIKNPPVNGVVTSLFGNRKHPILHKIIHHGGVDISAKMRSEVISPFRGWVLFAGSHQHYGNFVVINCGNNLCTLYAHLSAALVGTGDYVEYGTVIGLIGSTGRSTGPHLHYEMFTCSSPQISFHPSELGKLFACRKKMNPGLPYKMSPVIRNLELPFFKRLVRNINKNIR